MGLCVFVCLFLSLISSLPIFKAVSSFPIKSSPPPLLHMETYGKPSSLVKVAHLSVIFCSSFFIWQEFLRSEEDRPLDLMMDLIRQIKIQKSLTTKLDRTEEEEDEPYLEEENASRGHNRLKHPLLSPI